MARRLQEELNGGPAGRPTRLHRSRSQPESQVRSICQFPAQLQAGPDALGLIQTLLRLLGAHSQSQAAWEFLNAKNGSLCPVVRKMIGQLIGAHCHGLFAMKSSSLELRNRNKEHRPLLCRQGSGQIYATSIFVKCVGNGMASLIPSRLLSAWICPPWLYAC